MAWHVWVGGETAAIAAAEAKVWLAYYDEIAEIIDDEILDEADEQYDVDYLLEVGVELPDEYFITCAKKYRALHPDD